MKATDSIGSLVDVNIGSMAFTGRGVGRIDDKVIFVTGGIPGDVLRVRVTKRRRRYLEGVVTEILDPSPDRIKAPCRHFDQCGGCSFQSVSYEKQLEYKQEFVSDALLRIGGIEAPSPKQILSCRKQFYYRNKMEFSFLPTDSGSTRLGLHYRNRWSDVFDIEECLLQSETSNQIVCEARRLVNDLGIRAYHISEHHGFIRFLVIRDNKKNGSVLVNIVTNAGDFVHQRRLVEELTSRFPQIEVVYKTINSTRANVASGEKEELLWGNEGFHDSIGPFSFMVTPTTFLQTNPMQAEVLYEQLVSMADFSHRDSVLELYCGCGAISHFVSSHVQSVLGVEINAEAVRMAEENARINGISNCSFVAADSARYLVELKHHGSRFDCVVVDPPRAGVGNKVVRRIARLKPECIIYVSCNPSTLARDLDQFRQHGYKLVEIAPIDMFPHTFHVESVSRLEKA